MLSRQLHKPHNKLILYTLNMLLGLHIALIVYFNPAFLESKSISDKWLGTIFLIGSSFGILMYYALPKLINKLGVYKLMFITLFVELFLFMGMGHSYSIPIVIIFFIISLTTYIPISYGLDILLEANTKSELDTGSDRSLFLTMSNVAYTVSPFVAGMILELYNFATLYTISALILVPFIILLRKHFRGFKTPKQNNIIISKTLKYIYKTKDIRNIFIIQFLIRFFFAILVIYLPIYLINNIGFSLKDTGLIFSIILIPFILLEIPLGKYADKRYGEKEFLIAGFIIMAVSTYIISYITIADLALWMIVLFITRIGAAIIEIMNEVYFFKHVDEADTSTISMFRMLSPLAYIIGPIFVTSLLFFIPIQYIFGITGIILLSGVFYSSLLTDTK